MRHGVLWGLAVSVALAAVGCGRGESGPVPFVDSEGADQGPPAPAAKAPGKPLKERVQTEIADSPALAPTGVKVQVVVAGAGYVTLQVTAFPPSLCEPLAKGTSAALWEASARGSLAAEALVKLEQAVTSFDDVKAVFWLIPPKEKLAEARLALAKRMLDRGQADQAARQVEEARKLAPAQTMPDATAVKGRIDRARATKSLEAIGKALAQYHDRYRLLPPGFVAGKNRMPYTSWLTMILPNLGQAGLYNAYNFSASYDDVANSTCVRRVVDLLLAPDADRKLSLTGYGATYFAGVTVGKPGSRTAALGVFGMNSAVALGSICDGTSHTIVAGQIASNPPGWAEAGKTLRQITYGINQDLYRGFGSSQPGGALFLFADGSVRLLSEDIDPDVLRALATRAGGEPTPAGD